MRISEAKELLQAIVVYNMEQLANGSSYNTFIVPMFVGDPGLGKTAIPNQVAASLDIHYDQAIVAQYDAGEMAGLPFIGENADGHKSMIRLRPDYLPPEFEKIGSKNEPYTGIFNLDELPQAFLANQNIASQIVNEYRVGHHHISHGVTICCTGNKPENKAGTTTMPTHLRDRLMFIDIDANAEDWLDYAATRGIDPRVRAYIRQNPGKLHDFKPTQNSNPTPRSWEKVSGILSMGLKKGIRSSAINGQIGEGHGTTFEAWLRVEDKMPKIEDIISNPDGAPLFGNKDADVLYMLLASLSDIATPKNIEPIVKYLNRMPAQEFSVYFMHDALRRNKELSETKAVVKWKSERGIDLLLSSH